MEMRHRCKLCQRRFSNGRALGGHMKAHLAILPLPPKPEPLEEEKEEEEEENDDSDSYGLRENPKKSFRLADAELPAYGSVILQVPESNTMIISRRRSKSKRSRRTSPEEDVALCLMMLSRDVWNVNDMRTKERFGSQRKSVTKSKKMRAKKKSRSEHCKKEQDNENKDTMFECPFCQKVFGSGQALGGHKRSHQQLPTNISDNNINTAAPTSTRSINNSPKHSLDLNLPAPFDDPHDFGVLSPASYHF